MPKIERIGAYEVLDSRGNPTVKAIVYAEGGISGAAIVPSGASTGKHEAHELRDKDTARYDGKGVLHAVENIVASIQAALLGKDVVRQGKIDATLLELDGTLNKSRLGANAILAVSLACARAGAASQRMPLYRYIRELLSDSGQSWEMPIPQMNVINGGRHASNKLSIQEFHIVPAGAATFAEALRMGAEIYHMLKKLLLADGYQVEVGDEGGFAPPFKNSETAFTYLVRAIERAGYRPGEETYLGLDAAASEFYSPETELYMLDGGPVDAGALAGFYSTWRQRYPIVSIEDPFEQDRWSEWEVFVRAEGDHMQIVGDDLFATNSERLQEGIVRDAAGAVLVKPNQAGTLSETLAVIEKAGKAGMNAIISHRSGDTEDTFIADLAVAVGAGQIKTGAPARSERVAKYNRLLEIGIELGTEQLGGDLRQFTHRKALAVE